MHASNSVSTIFRCMSCSFGTHDQTLYAEHIKHCSSESSAGELPVTSDGETAQSNLSGKVKNCRNSYVCTECLLPTGGSKALLLHQRDVHGKDMKIFACRLCSHYAARYVGMVRKHAKSNHPESVYKSTLYTEIRKKSVNSDLSADKEASANEHDISKEQATHCDQDEGSRSGIVKSSRALGLHFLGKQLPHIGSGGYYCQLCSFSHTLTSVVVKHIWKDHSDRFSEVAAEASDKEASDDISVTYTVYKCDDCSYSSRAKYCFYAHCAHHQFEGTSKCPHCSYRALTDAAIITHARKYHTGHCLDDLKAKLSADIPKNIGTKISAPCKVAKSGNGCYKKLYGKNKWFRCAHCNFKSQWRSHVYHHMARVHTELSKGRRDRPSDTVSANKKLKKTNAADAKELNSKHFGGYQCPVCGLRSIYPGNITQHIKRMHKDDAEEVNSKNFGRYQCPLCGVRSNYAGNITKHINKVHKDDAEDISSVPKKAKRQKTSNSSLLQYARNTPLMKYKCNVCSVKFRTKKHLSSHTQSHLDFRRYQCPLCGLRGNYYANICAHIRKRHKNEKVKARPISLSLEDAKQTISAYRKQHDPLSHRLGKDKHFSATGKLSELVHPTRHGNSKAVQSGISTPNSHILLGSSEDSLLQVKEPRVDTSVASYSGLGTDFLGLQKRYACSICKMQSRHIGSVYRHVGTVHHGRKAKVISVKGKMSVQTSKLAIHKKTAKSWKLTTKTAGEDKAHDASVGSQFDIQTSVKMEVHDLPENSDDFKPTHTAIDASYSYCTPGQQLPVEHKAFRRSGFACGICPYRATALRDVIDHRKLHVKRSGYDFACSICPYFVRQASHLERHMKLHIKQSYEVSQNVDLRASQNTGRKARFHLCEHCPFMSVCPRSLMHHKQLHRRRAAALYKCEHCALWVTAPCHLIKHSRVHTAEYLQKRKEYSQLTKTSDSLGCDVMKVASEKPKMVASQLSAACRSEPDASSAENIVASGKGNLEEMALIKSESDRDDGTVKHESVSATEAGTANVSGPVSSSATGRQFPLWCCERCPYSASKLACFKRHVWLHDKQYPYECRYCSYSVRSYWQLVSHVLWHFAPNKHLVYAQSVSNLDSFPSQLPNRDSVPDSLAYIDRFIPSFENSNVFLLADAVNFQCCHCPFVTEQRSEFFTHMLCHNEHTAAYSCPYCNFHTDLPEKISPHILLHFDLPGCQQSFLPPNLYHSEDWKRLEAAIEAVAKSSTCSTEPYCILTDNSNGSYGQAESASPLKADALVTENQAVTVSESEDSQSVAKSPGMLAVVSVVDDSASMLFEAPQSSEYDVHAGESALTSNQHPSVDHGTASVNSSVMDEWSTSDSVTSVLTNKTKFCSYCSRLIDDTDALTKHEADHLIGSTATHVVRCCCIIEIYSFLYCLLLNSTHSLTLNRNIFVNLFPVSSPAQQCHYIHLHVLSFRFRALELYTAAVLLAQLTQPSGTNCRLRFWKRTLEQSVSFPPPTQDAFVYCRIH